MDCGLGSRILRAGDGLTNRSPFEQLAHCRSGLPSRQPNPPATGSARLVWVDHRPHSEAGDFKAPKYVANIVIVDRESTAVSVGDCIRSLYESVRPFGGVSACSGRIDARN